MSCYVKRIFLIISASFISLAYARDCENLPRLSISTTSPVISIDELLPVYFDEEIRDYFQDSDEQKGFFIFFSRF